MDSVTGIYLSTTGISWARLCRSGNVITDWNINHFEVLPKKMSMVDIFRLVSTITVLVLYSSRKKFVVERILSSIYMIKGIRVLPKIFDVAEKLIRNNSSEI